ncbi:MAG: hypothetical protein IPK16_30400, partial [Anaerolineales bacterium]|nr:hypothetical protein [Anaerolineales bacterium]
MAPQLHRPMNEMVLAPGACRDDKTCYRMRVALDYGRHQLEVEEIVDYANRTDQALSELKFVVEPNRTAGAFQLAEITNGAGVTVAGVQLRGAVLTAPLAKPLQP